MIGIVKKKISECCIARGKTFREKKYEAKDHISRMGIFLTTDVCKGDKLTIENVRFSFPNKGIGVEWWDLIENSSFLEDKKEGQSIKWDDIKIHTKS